jgi:plasmid stabilization system protein ParE
MAIEFTAAADPDLLHIYLTGAERWGMRQADRYAAAMQAALRMLEGNPRMVRERTEYNPP